MKFWELLSGFRNEPEIIDEVLNRPDWAEFLKLYKDYDEIVRNQRRDILDASVPLDLAYEIAEKSKLEFWLEFATSPQILRSYHRLPEIEQERLLSTEVLVRFGGDKIEEANEFGSAYVRPRALNGQIEVIGSFNLTAIGLLAVLRSEVPRLPANTVLKTLDRSRRWIISAEAEMTSSLTGNEKKQSQRKQHILHYLLTGIEHNEKPKPGSFLALDSTRNAISN